MRPPIMPSRSGGYPYQKFFGSLFIRGYGERDSFLSNRSQWVGGIFFFKKFLVHLTVGPGAGRPISPLGVGEASLSPNFWYT